VKLMLGTAEPDASQSRALLAGGKAGRGLGGRVKLYEAGDVQEPLDVLERAEAAEGDAPALAQLLAETLSSWGTGGHCQSALQSR
jgi:hypothetical protein